MVIANFCVVFDKLVVIIAQSKETTCFCNVSWSMANPILLEPSWGWSQYCLIYK